MLELLQSNVLCFFVQTLEALHFIEDRLIIAALRMHS